MGNLDSDVCLLLCVCVFALLLLIKHVSTSLRTPFSTDARSPSAFELSNHTV